MIFRASSSDQRRFLSLPETGMGYQVIEAKRYGKISKDRFVVLNSEIVIDLDTNFSYFKRQLLTEGYSKILIKAESLFIETSTISLVPRSEITEFRILTESKKEDKRRHPDGRGAADNSKELADGQEIFIRLSAYENDKRIDLEKKKFIPGTYATTNSDYSDCVRFNDDPVDRYALPNDEEIKWAFYVRPKMSDVLQRGIVQPAFGHDGGGIDIYFEKGTSDNTYLLRRDYGK